VIRDGLARRDASPHDRRASYVYISPEGVREMKKARSIVGRVNREITDGFTPEELASFRKILESFFQKFNASSNEG